MRVLFWAELFRPDIGGVEVHSGELIQQMQRRGHEFRVVANHGSHPLPDVSEFEGIQVHRFRFHRPLLNRDLRQVAEITRRVADLKESFRPDLIHVSTIQPSLLFHKQSEAAHRCPVLLTLCEPITPSMPQNSLLGRAVRAATWVNGVSGATLKSLHEFVPETRGRSSIVHYGLPLPDLEPSALSFEQPRLVCLGRIVNEKGFDLVLEAFASLIARFPQARLIIAGEGPAKAGLERQAQRLGLNGAVTFPGWVEPESVPELIDRSSIVVMPSRWQEPFGLVALQGAQMGRPVVASRVGGLPEVVADGETGLLVENEDVAGLASAIRYLIENPAVARRMGQAARLRAQERFSLQAHVDAYEKLYQQVTNQAGGGNA